MNLRNEKGNVNLSEIYTLVDPVRRAALLLGFSMHIRLNSYACNDGRFCHWRVLL